MLLDFDVSTKRRLFALIALESELRYDLSPTTTVDSLLARERLGSTGLGQGIAIPHGRMATLTKPCGLFARLAQPVDFDSIDERPVDIVFLLVAPEGAGADHLKALARVSRLLRGRALVAHFAAHANAHRRAPPPVPPAVRSLLSLTPRAAAPLVDSSPTCVEPHPPLVSASVVTGLSVPC